jgi:hypothetical protein
MHYVVTALLALFMAEPTADWAAVSPFIHRLQSLTALRALVGDIHLLLLGSYLLICHGTAAVFADGLRTTLSWLTMSNDPGGFYAPKQSGNLIGIGKKD